MFNTSRQISTLLITSHLPVYLSWVSWVKPSVISKPILCFSTLSQTPALLRSSLSSLFHFLQGLFCYWSFRFPPIAVETRHQISSGNRESLVRINKRSEECEGCCLSPLSTTVYMQTTEEQRARKHSFFNEATGERSSAEAKVPSAPKRSVF